MPELLSKYRAPETDTCTQEISPESAGWKYVGFEVFELKAGEVLSQQTDDKEVCLVLVGGKANVKSKTLDLNNIGDRMSPFERKKPYAVYLPNDDEFTLTANTDVEVAVCKAPGKGGVKARLITPDDIGSESRGKGFNKRHVHNILPETEPADSLLVVPALILRINTIRIMPHTKPIWKRPIIIVLTRPRALYSSVFTLKMVRLMNPWLLTIKMSSWCLKATTLLLH